jgi:hypothetical protein
MTGVDRNYLTEAQLQKLNELLSGLKYGTITIIVQDGKVIQIDKTEKHRF